MIIAIDTIVCLCCPVTLMHFSHHIHKTISVSSHIRTVCGLLCPLVICEWHVKARQQFCSCLCSLLGSTPIDAHFLTMATEDKKAETDTKPPVVPSASASQSKVCVHVMFSICVAAFPSGDFELRVFSW